MKRLEELLKEERMVSNGALQSPIAIRGNRLGGLYDLIKDCVSKDTVMVEIGSHRGVSTELFALHCKKIYAVDPWDLLTDYKEGAFSMPQSYARVEFNTRFENYSNVEAIQNFSVEASKLFEDESIDMVYIDGLHKTEAVTEDILTWTPKVKTGGVISGHDYRDPKVYRALMALLGDAPGEGVLGAPSGKTYSEYSWKFIKTNDLKYRKS